VLLGTPSATPPGGLSSFTLGNSGSALVPASAMLWIVGPILLVAIGVLARSLVINRRRTAGMGAWSGSDSTLGPYPIGNAESTDLRAHAGGCHVHSDVQSDCGGGVPLQVVGTD
jgi:hypothetical protein